MIRKLIPKRLIKELTLSTPPNLDPLREKSWGPQILTAKKAADSSNPICLHLYPNSEHEFFCNKDFCWLRFFQQFLALWAKPIPETWFSKTTSRLWYNDPHLLPRHRSRKIQILNCVDFLNFRVNGIFNFR